jgi:hypothetical protein
VEYSEGLFHSAHCVDVCKLLLRLVNFTKSNIETTDKKPEPATRTRARRSRYDELIAAGIIEPAAEPDALPSEWPDIRLPPGTAAELIDSDRGEP